MLWRAIQANEYPGLWSGRPACHCGVRARIFGKNVGKDAEVAN